MSLPLSTGLLFLSLLYFCSYLLTSLPALPSPQSDVVHAFSSQGNTRKSPKMLSLVFCLAASLYPCCLLQEQVDGWVNREAAGQGGLAGCQLWSGPINRYRSEMWNLVFCIDDIYYWLLYQMIHNASLVIVCQWVDQLPLRWGAERLDCDKKEKLLILTVPITASLFLRIMFRNALLLLLSALQTGWFQSFYFPCASFGPSCMYRWMLQRQV